MTSKVGDWLLKLRGQRLGNVSDPATIPTEQHRLVLDLRAALADLHSVVEDQRLIQRLRDAIAQQQVEIDRLERELRNAQRGRPPSAVSDTDYRPEIPPTGGERRR